MRNNSECELQYLKCEAGVGVEERPAPQCPHGRVPGVDLDRPELLRGAGGWLPCRTDSLVEIHPGNVGPTGPQLPLSLFQQ